MRRLGVAGVLLVVLLAYIGNASADTTQKLSITGGSADEGGRITFTVSLTDGPDNATVKFKTVDGTAGAGGDYDAEALQPIIVPAGGSNSFQVQTKQDTLDEPDETFTVELSEPENAVIDETKATAQGTIRDGDAPPVATIADAGNVTEGGTASFTVTLSAPSGRTVRVSYRTVDGTATADDYEAKAPGTILTIPAGQTTGTIEVKTKEDVLSEGDETFKVALGDPNETVRIGAANEAQATIKDDDALRKLSIAPDVVNEGDSGTVNLEFKVTLDAPSAIPVLVTASTENGSAVAPADYDVKTQRLAFAPGEVQKIFSVAVKGDTLDEADETLLVRLTDPVGATIEGARASASGTIRDNDNKSMLSIGDAEANEGSAGVTSTMTFKVTLAPASARAVTVGWATANGTATAGSDYTPASGSLAFAPGETEKSIAVTVLGDDVNEENETVLVNLSGAGGAGVADAQGVGTIVDKNAPPSLSIDDPTARESEGATFTVTLAGATLRTVTVTFSTGDGTARDGSDYSARRGTLTFAPGERTKTVAVTVLDDTVSESLETFSVNLGDPVNAVITKGRGVASIEASDQATTAGTGTTTAPRQTPPAATPKTTPTLFPRMVLGPRSLTLTSVGRARMQLTCAKTSKVACVGVVSLENSTKPAMVLGKRSFAVKKGRLAYIPVTLTDRGFALVQKRRTLRVRAVVFIKAGGKRYRIVPGVILVKATKTPEPRGQAGP